MNESNEYISKQIRDYRSRNSITQAEFAKRIEVSRSTLSLIEKGELTPSLETFFLISREINLNLQKLFDIAAKDIIIIDTNVMLKRPQFIETIIEDCSYVYIPETVSNELNYKKDHGQSSAQKKCAALCMHKINELLEQKRNIEIYHSKKYDFSLKNDDAIFDAAEKIAAEYKQDHVYLLTNDIYFKLKISNTGCTNLKVINSLEYETIFHPEHKNEYNAADYAKFISLVKTLNYKEIESFNFESVNINVCDSVTGFTPLITAVINLAKIKKKNARTEKEKRDYIREENARETLLALLKTNKINVNTVDSGKFGFPPLTHAIQAGDVEIVNILLEHGASVNEPSRNSKNAMNTPLMVSAWHGYLDISKILIENGACINQQDKGNGFTPLIKAIFNSHDEVARLLIEKGADIAIQSHDKKRAIDYACDNKLDNLVDLLKDKRND